MLMPTHRIRALPGNPQIVVAPFLPENGEGHLPWTGRMISEILVMGLWQVPSLNIYHHWLLPRTHWHITRHHSRIEKYVERVAQTIRAGIIVTGTYRYLNKRLLVECNAWDVRESQHARVLSEMQAEGNYDDLFEWLPCVGQKLLQKSFPHTTIDFPPQRTLIDAPIKALELACASIDCLTFDGGEEPAQLYMREAQTLAPDSVYLRFMSTLIGEHTRDVTFCSELVEEKPEFVPAYFADGALKVEDNDELYRARDLYVRGLSLSPLNVHGYFGLREICAKLGDAQTLIYFAKIHTTRGTFSNRYTQFGDTFQTCMETAAEYHQYEMARQLFDAAMEMAEDPYDRSMLLSTRGWVEEAAGQLEEALKFYEEAWRIHHAPRIKVWIAHIYFKKHDYAQAASLYENLMLHPRGIDKEIRLRIRYRFARCLELLGREEEAMQIYGQLSRVEPFSDLTYTIVFDAYRRWQALKEQRTQR